MRIAICIMIAALAAGCGSPEVTDPAQPSPAAKDSAAAPPVQTEGHQVIGTRDGGRMEGFLRDGKRDGPWVSYFAHSGVRSRISYVDGVEEGPTEVYQENGMTYYTGQYRKGATVGEWVFYDPQGKELKRVVYDSLGTVIK